MLLLMPINCRIHFKTAFDFISNSDEDPMITIRGIIYQWAKNHKAVGKDTKYQLYPTWFMRGDSEQHNINKAFIRTASNYGKYTKDSPEHWVMEFIHEDDSFPQRIWSVNVGIARIDEYKVRFSCIVKYAIRENYIGYIPELPVPTVPKFIKNILSSNNGKCYRDNIKIEKYPTTITNDNIDIFLKELCDKSRHLPFIVISLDKDYLQEFSPANIQNKIIGNANIFILEDIYTCQFNKIIPYNLRFRKNMVRIYFNIKDNDDGYRHRFYYLDRHEEPNSLIEEYIITALARNAHNFKPKELSEIKQIIFLRDQYRIDFLKANIDKNNYEELIGLYSKELENIQNRLSENEELLQLYEEENQKLNDTVRSYTWKLADYKDKLNENSLLRNQISRLSKKFFLPTDICSCLHLAQHLYATRIIVHQNAIKSANNFELKSSKNIIEECWNILSAIAFDLYKLKFEDCSTNLQEAFSNKTGISFSMTESSASKKDSYIAKLRTLEYKGKNISFYPHFRSKQNSRFRIHIAFLDDEKKLLICHCGEHLDNAMTRHLK